MYRPSESLSLEVGRVVVAWPSSVSISWCLLRVILVLVVFLGA